MGFLQCIFNRLASKIISHFFVKTLKRSNLYFHRYSIIYFQCIWQCKEVTIPRGVSCYRDEFVLVIDNTTVHSMYNHYVQVRITILCIYNFM